MFETEIEKCKELLENIEKFGYCKNEYDFVNSLKEETTEFIAENGKNEDVVEALGLSLTLLVRAQKYFVTYHELSEDIGYAQHEGRHSRKGFTSTSAFALIPVVKKINAMYCIEKPTKAPNKVAFGWNYAFSKDNPRAYLYGCIRNYLKDNGVEFTDDEVKMMVGFKKDPFYEGILY